MILLRKDIANKFVLTLTELSELTDPYYLFEFFSDSEKKSYYKIIEPDHTYDKGRQLFTLTEGTDIDFEVAGFFVYKVYEQASDSNLDPLLASKLLENGIALLIGDENSKYYNDFTVANNMFNG